MYQIFISLESCSAVNRINQKWAWGKSIIQHRLRQDHNIWLILVHSDGELGAWEGWPNELSIFVVIIVVGHFTIQRRLVTLSAVNAGSQDQPKIEIKNRLTLNVYIGAKDIVQFNILLHDLLIQIITLPWWSG